jgi:hypothetical protein
MTNPPPGAWLSQIESARSVAELVRMLRDYLGSISVEDRAHLPAQCTPDNISSAADIQEWAVALAHADLRATGGADATHALHQAALVFAAAGTRLPRVAE